MVIDMKRYTLLIPALVLVMCAPVCGYTFSESRKDTPADFNSFLADCTVSERIQLMQSLQALPDEYNTMKPEEVLSAVNSGKVSAEKVSPSEIRKAIVWRAYNKITYPFRNDKEIDYHGILQWAAKKSDVTGRRIDEFSTYKLEREVSEEYFAKVWDKLSPAERTAMLAGAAGAAALGAGAAYGVIAVSAVMPVLPVVMAVWGIAGPESGTVSGFIMTVNIIKTRKYVR